MDESLTRAREEREEARRRTERRRGRIIIVVLVLLLGFTAFSGIRQLRGGGSDVAGSLGIADYRARQTGERRPAPSFTYPGLHGEDVGSELLQDKVGVVNFWASWCGPCRVEAPGLQRLWERYQGRGVQFLGVNFRDDRYSARAFEDEFGLTYPSAFDPSGSLAGKFQVLALPSTFVIGRDGWIEHQFTGIVSEELIRSLIEDELGGGR
ncbi:MAG: TlpA family protein disulfide reductase [Actinomycetota bacterium]